MYTTENYREVFDLLPKSSRYLDFDNWLRANTEWTFAPCSGKYHLSVAGGLLTHSINVLNNALSLIPYFEGLGCKVSLESVVLVALYHDVGKVGAPGYPRYVPDLERGRFKTAHKWGGRFGLPVPEMSVELISLFFDLSLEERQAILAHDGQYVADNRRFALKEYPLTLLVHHADVTACVITEK